jgi:hypothetical protein
LKSADFKQRLNQFLEKKVWWTETNWAEQGIPGRPICASWAGKRKKKWADEWVLFVGDPLKMKGYAASLAVGLKEDLTALIYLLHLTYARGKTLTRIELWATGLTGKASQA